ncbi:uncharacterized protein [Physcomitrium patens]|uniref:Uncharacterized protein n=1 Tax=Physcomitrium patens TaxID=3218 RepID=A0A2K1K433_PHYPA|nr:uncharacterized protein LOC112286504 [Physcomitrium patens]PNR48535.1 hypothetical protein PHYPA_013012 [Physcomitrium patens]|eukprot:XP_024384205.1 uncharacterized protein LOC112286504 [Physcomitrella patens]
MSFTGHPGPSRTQPKPISVIRIACHRIRLLAQSRVEGHYGVGACVIGVRRAGRLVLAHGSYWVSDPRRRGFRLHSLRTKCSEHAHEVVLSEESSHYHSSQAEALNQAVIHQTPCNFLQVFFGRWFCVHTSSSFCAKHYIHFTM